MATRRQQAFETTILLELITTTGGRASVHRWGREESESESYFYDNICSYFEYSPAERIERCPSNRQLKLRNDVYFARNVLRSEKYIEFIRNDHWEITEKGVRRIADYVRDIVRTRMDDDDILQLLLEKNESYEEFIVQVLRCVPSDELPSVVGDSRSLVDLFRNAVANLASEAVQGFLTSVYERIKPFVSRNLARQYGLVPASHQLTFGER
jgi:hypothetical protein